MLAGKLATAKPQNTMKKLITILLMGFIIMNYSCTKEETKPDGKITFWLSKDNGCGNMSVSIDGNNVGQITNWQVIAPTTCASSNLLLTVTTKQGTKSVTFKNNCGSRVVSINLNSDCYIYNVYKNSLVKIWHCFRFLNPNF
jgi:hypothetical protein